MPSASYKSIEPLREAIVAGSVAQIFVGQTGSETEPHDVCIGASACAESGKAVIKAKMVTGVIFRYMAYFRVCCDGIMGVGRN